MTSDPPAPRDRSVAAEISTGVVRLLAEYTGRGPTKARTTITDDLVVCVLQDTLTRGEQRLVDAGQADKVLDTRRTYQRVMSEALIALVEEQTGRRVQAFLSDNHVGPDVAVELFLLEPSLD